MKTLDHKLTSLESEIKISCQEKLSKCQDSLGESIVSNVQKLRSEIQDIGESTTEKLKKF